jgi:hypothetical protein
VAALLTEYEERFLSDLGGRAHASEKEQALCRLAAEYCLYRGLIRSRLFTSHGDERRLPQAQQQSVLQLHARLGDALTRTLQALGLKRQETDALEIQVRRYTSDPAQPGGGNGQ